MRFQQHRPTTNQTPSMIDPLKSGREYCEHAFHLRTKAGFCGPFPRPECAHLGCARQSACGLTSIGRPNGSMIIWWCSRGAPMAGHIGAWKLPPRVPQQVPTRLGARVARSPSSSHATCIEGENVEGYTSIYSIS